MQNETPASGGVPPNLQKWINSGHLILGFVTAIGAAYVGVQQHFISKEQRRLADAQAALRLQVETQERTTRYADELGKYMEAVATQEDQDRINALKIDLADAVTAAASSESGDLTNGRLIRMPMWLALATGNDDALRLIASDAERRTIWLRLAQASTDKKVRETAIDVIKTSTDLPPVDILRLIFELSDELDNPEVEVRALEAMQQLLGRMKRRGDPALEPGDGQLQPIFTRLSSMRTSVRGQMTVAGLSPETRELLQQRESLLTAALEPFAQQETVTAAGRGDSQNTSYSSTVDAQQARENEGALRALDSDSSEARRTARATLANQLDPTSAAKLLDYLQDSSAGYREKLGALVVLRDTSKNVRLSGDDIGAIVALMGDDDATMRMASSELLMKVTDPESVRIAREQLTVIVDTRDDARARPNQVYNAVAVLGTWSRVLPDSLSRERETIDDFLRTEKGEMEAAGNWNRTAQLISELLALKDQQMAAR